MARHQFSIKNSNQEWLGRAAARKQGRIERGSRLGCKKLTLESTYSCLFHATRFAYPTGVPQSSLCDNKCRLSGENTEKVKLDSTPKKCLIQMSAALFPGTINCSLNKQYPCNFGAYGFPRSYHKKTTKFEGVQ